MESMIIAGIIGGAAMLLYKALKHHDEHIACKIDDLLGHSCGNCSNEDKDNVPPSK